MQVPILQGAYADAIADVRVSYPVNMVPVPVESGVSNGYLRPAEGAVKTGTGPGASRGGINWNGVCYRVMGTSLVRINPDASYTTLGDVGGYEPVTMDYSFDRLAIASNGDLWYWDGVALTQVADPDLGTCLDVVWIDGYFLSTDGEFLIVTELTNPLSVNPLKYGSSEADPDPIEAVHKLRNELFAVNRYTIEAFSNVGGDFFPFQRIEGAQIQKGSLGRKCSCVLGEAIAFLGSGRKESPAIYVTSGGVAAKISTREIDSILGGFTEAQLSQSILEARIDKGSQHLWVRLPDRTLVFDAATSQVAGRPIWFQLTSAVEGFSAYRAKDIVWCYDQWLVADASNSDYGYLTTDLSSHFGDVVRWEFGTTILYNEGKGLVVHAMELVALNGKVVFGEEPQISTAYSVDGQSWSQEKYIRAGANGELRRRLVWFRQGGVRNWRIQRVRGDSRSYFSASRLELDVEPLKV